MGQLDELRTQMATMTEKVNEIAAAQTEEAAATTEIASDLNDLIAKLAAGVPGSQEVIDATAEATALTAQLTTAAATATAQAQALKDAAAKHTP